MLLGGSDVELATAIPRYKGAVLDSVVEDRLVAEASRDPDQRKLIEQLQSTRQQLGGLLLQTAHEESTERNKRIEELENASGRHRSGTDAEGLSSGPGAALTSCDDRRSAIGASKEYPGR